MTSCEKCWIDANGQFEYYQELIEERKDNPCTPEEQAGPDATKCFVCERMTIHQHTKICIICNNK